MSNVDGESTEVSALRAECARLRTENAHLRSLLAPLEAEPHASQRRQPLALAPAAAAPSPPSTDTLVTSDSPVPAKLALFRGLFQGRAGVFARRWTSVGGRAGYAPAC